MASRDKRAKSPFSARCAENRLGERTSLSVRGTIHSRTRHFTTPSYLAAR